MWWGTGGCGTHVAIVCHGEERMAALHFGGASRDRGLDVAHTLFSGPPADIASIVEEELAGHASTVGEVDGIR
ncbi:hypothetical protein V6N13_130508 [Hibiscus sabdariffa]